MPASRIYVVTVPKKGSPVKVRAESSSTGKDGELILWADGIEVARFAPGFWSRVETED